MTTASSVATFLDVRQPGSAAGPSATPEADPQATTRAAAVLAAINDGGRTFDQIRQKSNLSTADAVAALSWLEKAGLVTLSESDKSLQAELTPEATAALR